MSEKPPGARRAKPYLWALGLLWLLPAVAVTIGYLVLPKDVADGRCEGIGFGCTLSPAETLLFFAFLVGLPVLVAAGILAVVTIAVVQLRKERRSVRAGRSRAPRRTSHP